MTMPGSTCTVTVGGQHCRTAAIRYSQPARRGQQHRHCELHAYRHRARLPRRSHWHGNHVRHTAVRVGLADQRDAVTIDS